MKALTVKVPWSFAIAHGSKRVENRGWPAPPGLTELAIHAGARSGWDYGGEDSPLVQEAWFQWLVRTGHLSRDVPRDADLSLTEESRLLDFGAVVAVAKVDGCHWAADCDREVNDFATIEYCSQWAMPGQYHWQLKDVRTLATPVPCRGHQKLWTLPDDVEQAVRAQLARNSEPPMDTPKQVADELFRRAFGHTP